MAHSLHTLQVEADHWIVLTHGEPLNFLPLPPDLNRVFSCILRD